MVVYMCIMSTGGEMTVCLMTAHAIVLLIAVRGLARCCCVTF